FEAVGISSSKVTHINQKSAINMVSHQGVSSDQQRQVGRWELDRMVVFYLSDLPINVIKVLAGFSIRREDYFPDHAIITPPIELQQMI
ncbi:hypothetical protein PHYBLDRAFT_91875, partial [Phycomyces blakesleeanus NRRL 1555(-)]